MQWSSGTMCTAHLCVQYDCMFVCVYVSTYVSAYYVHSCYTTLGVRMYTHTYIPVPVPGSDPVPSTSPAAQVWMVVQRKWMYLESIFLAGDIRAQLPEEAKKFDVIDKTFKKVTLGAVYLCMRLLCWHICGMNSWKG